MRKKYTFREALQSDFDFLFELNKVTMKNYVIATWGKWDDEWQRQYFQEKFRPEEYQIIVIANKNVGVLAITEDEKKIEIDRLQLMPEFQGSGIGTAILNDLITKVGKNQKSLCLTVLKSNERAKQLYEKKGFHITDENEERYFMCFNKNRHQNTSTNSV